MDRKKKTFPLRLDVDIYSALEKWAADDLRSVNSQIEYVLREILRKEKRLKQREDPESEK